MKDRVAKLRKEYAEEPLNKADASDDPVELLEAWLDQALAVSARELPNAMTLATADKEGHPSARVVLLKDIDERGLVFYTNYRSRKGRELDQNPHAALVFWWPELNRQVRVEGLVEKVSDRTSDAYFRTRPRGSQLGAVASNQSQELADRQELIARMNEVREQFEGQEVPRPSHWGGYRLGPVRFEFWQGRENRLHDRIRYERVSLEETAWSKARLAP